MIYSALIEELLINLLNYRQSSHHLINFIVLYRSLMFIIDWGFLLFSMWWFYFIESIR